MKKSLFLKLSIKKMHECFEGKILSPLDVAKACIEEIKNKKANYSAFSFFSPEKLLIQARNSEKRLMNDEKVRLLEGIPLGVKDVFNSVDFVTEMGSELWANFTPGNDARAIFNLKRVGGIVAGKTVTAEFGVHSLKGLLNPYDFTRTPGTSSSGSAIAIATGMVPVALGTQTAGSIVRPASFCGVYGCKPSFGLIPRTGVLKTSDAFDTIGFFTIYFEDLRTVFDALRVRGSNFPLSNEALSDNARQSKRLNKPWRIALVRTHTWQYAFSYAKEAILNWSKKLSGVKDIKIEEVDLSEKMSRAHEIHEIIYNKSLSYYFKAESKKVELISSVMKRMIIKGGEISVEEYKNAFQQQLELVYLMDDFFKNYDVIISLSTAGEASLLNETIMDDPALMWTMTYLPVICVPLFCSPKRLPFGVQLVARRYNDILLFRFAQYLRYLNLIPEKINPSIGTGSVINKAVNATKEMAS